MQDFQYNRLSCYIEINFRYFILVCVCVCVSKFNLFTIRKINLNNYYYF